jgi:protein disulfide-isomerase
MTPETRSTLQQLNSGPMASAMATPAATAPDTRQLPPGAPPLGFEGYCPVSMRNMNLTKWVPGDPKWGAIHRGRTYWFAGAQEQQQFLAQPDYYAPALSGDDPVMAIDHHQTVPGLRAHSLDYDNQFYMFSSEATLQQFTANPERYAASVRQAMGMPPGQHVR